MQLLPNPARLDARITVEGQPSVPTRKSVFRVTLCAVAAVSSLCLPGERGWNTSAAPGDSDYRISSGRSAKVPFELFGNNILLQFRINGSQPIWLIFDTGASVSVVDARLAKSLGLNTNTAASVAKNGGSIADMLTDGATVSLPGLEVYGQLITPLALDSLPAYFGRNIQGIIGSDFIKHFVVEIDYASRMLTFHDPETYKLSGEQDVIEIEERGGIPSAKVEFSVSRQDTVTGQFEIVTGSNRILDVNKPFADAHNLMTSLPKKQMREGVAGSGFGGNTKYVDARIGSFKLGPHVIDKPIISIAQDAPAEAASDAAGTIGGDLLRRFNVVLDYPSRLMRLQPNVYYDEPFEVDMSGLELMSKADDFSVIQIKTVREGFPAAQAGLMAGDSIVAVDGRPAAKLGLDGLAKIFKQPDMEYVLTVKRGEKMLTAKLKMKRAV